MQRRHLSSLRSLNCELTSKLERRTEELSQLSLPFRTLQVTNIVGRMTLLIKSGSTGSVSKFFIGVLNVNYFSIMNMQYDD